MAASWPGIAATILAAGESGRDFRRTGFARNIAHDRHTPQSVPNHQRINRATQHQDRRHARPRVQRPGSAATHDRRRRRCRPPQFLARPRVRPRRARATGARVRAAGWAARSASWPTCRDRRSASASSPTARSASKPGQAFILDADCELGDGQRVGLDYKELPQRRRARRRAAARRRPDRLDVERSTARASSRASCWAARCRTTRASTARAAA